MRLIKDLHNAIRDAAVFNPEAQLAPKCILWPDRDPQREVIMSCIQIKNSNKELREC